MDRRTLVTAMALILMCFTLVSTASAQTPLNDDFSGSTVFGDLPFFDTADLASATLEANVQNEGAHWMR